MADQYRPSRRAWVKLWTNEWMTGTIRWQLTGAERATWADLLCLAGMSRFPGIIASGYESDEQSPLMGYPASWLASQCGNLSETELLATLRKLKTQDRIEIEETNGFFLVKIKSWEKYQSEYMLKRQRRQYNEPARSDGDQNVPIKSEECPPKTPPEEVEVEGEVDGEKPTPLRQEARAGTSFETFWERYPKPRNKKAAQRAWNRLKETQRQQALEALEKFKASLEWRRERGRFVPYAQKFLSQELYLESPSGGTASGLSFDERVKRATTKKT